MNNSMTLSIKSEYYVENNAGLFHGIVLDLASLQRATEFCQMVTDSSYFGLTHI